MFFKAAFLFIFVQVHCNSLKYTNHAIEFMAKRAITEPEVENAIILGETIEDDFKTGKQKP